MKTRVLFLAFATVLFTSCNDDSIDDLSGEPLEETTVNIAGQAIIKIDATSNGWVALKETIQPQYMITRPVREISWMNEGFSQLSNYKADTIWWLNDIAVHPSGQVSAVSVRLDLNNGADYAIRVKVMRFRTDGSFVEQELTPLEIPDPGMTFFPGCLDRAKIVAHGEDAYVVARWKYNDVQAHKIRFDFLKNELKVEWKKVVEPDSYVGLIGIIGGGYDNFRQGDRYYFIYAEVDDEGNLYVGVPSTEELLYNHDRLFGEDLMSGTDPSVYDFGLAVLTKMSASGERIYSKLQGNATKQRLINMRVHDNGVYFVGRIKTGTQPNSWDALIIKSDPVTGEHIYESTIDVRDGDMFWDVGESAGGGAIAAGTTDYTQNPHGASVSDARKAAAIVLDAQGKMVNEIPLPQGPAGRGSEAMFIKVLGSGRIIFAGVHNAPGTHSAVYCDGFVAVR